MAFQSVGWKTACGQASNIRKHVQHRTTARAGSRDDVLEPSVYDLARESARVEGGEGLGVQMCSTRPGKQRRSSTNHDLLFFMKDLRQGLSDGPRTGEIECREGPTQSRWRRLARRPGGGEARRANLQGRHQVCLPCGRSDMSAHDSQFGPVCARSTFWHPTWWTFSTRICSRSGVETTQVQWLG